MALRCACMHAFVSIVCVCVSASSRSVQMIADRGEDEYTLTITFTLYNIFDMALALLR